jgi:hypothetical protein
MIAVFVTHLFGGTEGYRLGGIFHSVTGVRGIRCRRESSNGKRLIFEVGVVPGRTAAEMYATLSASVRPPKLFLVEDGGRVQSAPDAKKSATVATADTWKRPRGSIFLQLLGDDHGGG